MIKTIEAIDEMKTVKVEKDTWILELPEELCSREGLAKGTLASLTVKDGAIHGTFIRPNSQTQESAERFINKYSDFMKEIEGIDG